MSLIGESAESLELRRQAVPETGAAPTGVLSASRSGRSAFSSCIGCCTNSPTRGTGLRSPELRETTLHDPGTQVRRDLDERLDEALEMTFPASDPIAVHSPDLPPRSSVGSPLHPSAVRTLVNV